MNTISNQKHSNTFNKYKLISQISDKREKIDLHILIFTFTEVYI